MERKLEICAYNIQSCLVAQNNGASRVELCAEPLQGGTTPSYGLIKMALDRLTIPVFPIIRPRGGNFCYNADELEIMKSVILMCRQMGCEGISSGVSLPDGSIDEDAMRQIVEWATPMEVTCHKVFDAAPDLDRALDALIAAGCHRVLSSGGQPKLMAGLDKVANLIHRASGRIVVMPGGGLRSSNLQAVISATDAREFHSSCITVNDSQYLSDALEIVKMLAILK